MPQRESKPGISQTVVDLECRLAELMNAVAEKTEIADRFSQKLKDRDVTVRELGVVIDSERQNVRLVREELRKANAQIRELERQHAQESESPRRHDVTTNKRLSCEDWHDLPLILRLQVLRSHYCHMWGGESADVVREKTRTEVTLIEAMEAIEKAEGTS
ncbi:hypothetical protein K0U83_03645 [bacterium]|nr:hypothetical protein [bacterium]